MGGGGGETNKNIEKKNRKKRKKNKRNKLKFENKFRKQIVKPCVKHYKRNYTEKSQLRKNKLEADDNRRRIDATMSSPSGCGGCGGRGMKVVFGWVTLRVMEVL